MKRNIGIISAVMAVIMSILFVLPASASISDYADTAKAAAVKAMEYHKDNLSYLFAEDYEGEDAIKADMEHVLAAYAAGVYGMEGYEYLSVQPDITVITDASYSREYAKGIIISIINDDMDGVKQFADALCLRQDASGSFKTAGAADIMDDAWALISLQAAKLYGYDAKYDAAAAIDAIISQKKQDGGYNNYGDDGAVDVTATMLMAMSFFDYTAANTERESCISFIKSKLGANGLFEYYGADSSCAQAYTIIGLIMAGEDVTSDKWTTNGVNIVDALLSFQDENGGFWSDSASKNGTGWFTAPDDYSTRQCVMALGAVANAEELYANISGLTDLNPSQPDSSASSSTGSTASTPANSDSSSQPEEGIANPSTGQGNELGWVIGIAAAAVVLVAATVIITVINSKKKK